MVKSFVIHVSQTERRNDTMTANGDKHAELPKKFLEALRAKQSDQPNVGDNILRSLRTNEPENSISLDNGSLIINAVVGDGIMGEISASLVRLGVSRSAISFNPGNNTVRVDAANLEKALSAATKQKTISL